MFINKPFVVLTLLIPTFMFAQKKFHLELDAPSYINNKLIFSPPYIRRGFEKFYYIKLDTNKNVIDFGSRFGFEQSAFKITVQEKNIIEGELEYPIPFSFQFFDSKAEREYVTSTFFLDSGNYKIQLPRMFDFYEVNINSHTNSEYLKFKKLFSDLYVKSVNGNRCDSLTNLIKKEEVIGSYIKKYPNSYVALWEIVNDYTLYNYNSLYLDNLQLFSDEIKKTEFFREFEYKLESEKSAMIGKQFPTISFDNRNTLTKEYFMKYKLTFIDYWTTTCGPCIKAMPEIVAMYKEYKDRGVNFITITDESEPQKIELAKEILNKNKVNWTNYFDKNKDFKNKVNATAYPLQFLVDQNGIIVTRVFANLNEIKRIMDANLK